MSFIADLLAKIGMGAATTGTQGCFILITDEPKMPKSRVLQLTKLTLLNFSIYSMVFILSSFYRFHVVHCYTLCYNYIQEIGDD